MMQILLAVISIVLTLCCSVSARAASPEWVEAFQQGSLISEDAYFGVGTADYKGIEPDFQCRRLSKDRALDDLSYQLSVSITSQLQDQLAQKGKYSQEQVSSSLFVSTRKVLNGITEKEKWTDIGKGSYWVMLSIDKESARKQVDRQEFINEVAQRLEKKQAEINSGIKKLNLLFAEHNKRIDHRMQRMEGMLDRINSKISPSQASADINYTLFMQKLHKVGQQWQLQEKIVGDQTQRLDLLMRQNQILTQQLAQILKLIQKDPYLAMVEDDVKNQQADEKLKVTITPEKGPNSIYTAGETIRFLVTANGDCYIKVIYASSIGSGSTRERFINTLLFPNPHDRDNKVSAGVTTLIGRENELVVEPPFGKDIITVVASARQFTDIDTVLTNGEGQYYSYETHSTRGAVKARSIGVRKKATDTCFIITRTQ